MSTSKIPEYDFREKLYTKYVSTFKNSIAANFSYLNKTELQVLKKRFSYTLNKISKDANFLELGCGSGYLLEYLTKEGFQNLFGIDISEEQIINARNKGLNVIAGNVFDFFQSNNIKYDVIFALDFIEHFNKEEILKLFEGIEKLLSVNGMLIIRTPNGQGLMPGKNIYGDLTHLTIFNPNSLLQILQLNNFGNIQFYEEGPVIKNFVGFIRFILWKIIKFVYKGIRIIETGESEDIITQNFICVARKNSV